MVVGPFVISFYLFALTISLVSGVLLFMMTSPFSKSETRKALSGISDLFVWLLIFIWVGKVLLKWEAFWKDPISILIYPSNHQALYIGLLLTLFLSLWRYGYRKGAQVIGKSFVLIVNYALFVYSFMAIIWTSSGMVYLGELVLAGVLVIWQVVSLTAGSPQSWWYGMFGAIIAGKFMLTLILGETFLFHYKVDLWVWIFMSIIFVSLLYIKKVRT
ncbi:hypothetical protein GCM10011389_33800 [Pontibacillus salipaludis]|uniref:Uncharacterized protein n=2 Tax=Pontibacillus salipaludis TaxID=1697394 RepID=A0ABQ1QDD5_9BACI|nr:hypothetical protein GCM10011389_33800 [Pontibacillus salipaludis]